MDDLRILIPILERTAERYRAAADNCEATLEALRALSESAEHAQDRKDIRDKARAYLTPEAIKLLDGVSMPALGKRRLKGIARYTSDGDLGAEFE